MRSDHALSSSSMTTGWRARKPSGRRKILFFRVLLAVFAATSSTTWAAADTAAEAVIDGVDATPILETEPAEENIADQFSRRDRENVQGVDRADCDDEQQQQRERRTDENPTSSTIDDEQRQQERRTGARSGVSSTSRTAKRPNVLLILADDLGTGDVPGYWENYFHDGRFYNDTYSTKVRMPTIRQELVEKGVLFEDAHSAPLCAPSRYVLMSGNYQHRGTHRSGTWTLPGKSALRKGQQTIARVLKNGGMYDTSMFGKWHLGGGVPGVPGERWGKIGDRILTHPNHNWRKLPLKQGPKWAGFDHSYITIAGIQNPPYSFFRNGFLTTKLHVQRKPTIKKPVPMVVLMKPTMKKPVPMGLVMRPKTTVKRPTARARRGVRGAVSMTSGAATPPVMSSMAITMATTNTRPKLRMNMKLNKRILYGPRTGVKWWKVGSSRMPRGISIIKDAGEGDKKWDSSAYNSILAKEFDGFLEKRNGATRPFFSYVALGAVHIPHSPPDYYYSLRQAIQNNQTSPVKIPVAEQYPTRHMDMISEVDLVVESLLFSLESRDLLKDTIIIFTSDNGGLSNLAARDPNADIAQQRPSGPLRGGKGDIWEGGHRVPLLMRYDGHFPAAERRDRLVGLNDLFATICDLTGVPVPSKQAVDSISFVDSLFDPPASTANNGAVAPVREYLVTFRFNPVAWAIRKQNFKFIQSHKGLEMLFDLDDDISETKNLIADPVYAPMVQDMKKELWKTDPKKVRVAITRQLPPIHVSLIFKRTIALQSFEDPTITTDTTTTTPAAPPINNKTVRKLLNRVYREHLNRFVIRQCLSRATTSNKPTKRNLEATKKKLPRRKPVMAAKTGTRKNTRKMWTRIQQCLAQTTTTEEPTKRTRKLVKSMKTGTSKNSMKMGARNLGKNERKNRFDLVTWVWAEGPQPTANATTPADVTVTSQIFSGDVIQVPGTSRKRDGRLIASEEKVRGCVFSAFVDDAAFASFRTQVLAEYQQSPQHEHHQLQQILVTGDGDNSSSLLAFWRRRKAPSGV